MAKQRSHVPARYPSPEELPQLIAGRRKLAERLMMAMVIRDEDEAAADKIMEILIQGRGRAEVARMMARLMESLERPDDSAAEAEKLYNAYVASWRRFGGERPLLSFEEHRRLRDERAAIVAKEMFEEQTLSREEQRQVDELGELIFAEPHLWDDLVPPNPPASVASRGPRRLPASAPVATTPAGAGAAASTSSVTCAPMRRADCRRVTVVTRIKR